MGFGRRSDGLCLLILVSPVKGALAARLKQTTLAGNRWLAERLHMGTPVAVSHDTGQLRQGLRPAAQKFEARLQILNIKT